MSLLAVPAPLHYIRETKRFQRQLIEHALACTPGNKSAAARLLGIRREYLWTLRHRLPA